RRDTSPMDRGNDGAIWKRERPVLESLDRFFVAELRAQLVNLGRYYELVHGDHFPIAVSGRDFHSVDRGGVSIGLSKCVGHVGDNAGQRRNCKQQETDPFHRDPPFQDIEHHLLTFAAKRSLTSAVPFRPAPPPYIWRTSRANS